MVDSYEWWHQMIDKSTPSILDLCEKVNQFLYSLTSDFVPLQTPEEALEPVPVHLLVSSRVVYKALRSIKIKKSAGPDPVPSVIWKEFALRVCPGNQQPL